MVVKVKKKTKIMEENIEVTQYMPDNIPLTRERREKADLLDAELKKMAENINKEYEILDDFVKKDELKKWRWLGAKIDKVLKSLKNLDQTDVDNHAIWPALGQYFRDELKRGFDARRSGTKKDHYRKCWLIATLPDTDWFNSWSGWDAFIDRGEQLVTSNKIIPKLKDTFSANAKLKPRDYQKIAKMITERIPSGTNKPADIGTMSDDEIGRVIKSVYESFIEK
ncbi:MAG: hypothetical protein AAB946_02615 [Patescibacteria group bacterium]